MFKLTKVFEVDDRLVVANSIEDAVRSYIDYYKTEMHTNIEPKEVKQIIPGGYAPNDLSIINLDQDSEIKKVDQDGECKYLNIFHEGIYFRGGHCYDTEIEARSEGSKSPTYVKTIKVGI